MNILRLDLLAFGPFEDVRLEFAEPLPGLHVVYGDNEAGKSTCLRAVKQWLFGIPHKATDDFRVAATRLRIGGRLQNQMGETFDFVRRKGRKDTLRSVDDREVVPEQRLQAFLGSIDANEFSQRFSLDHQELVRGGTAIGTSGEMGEVLFAAGAGLADIRGIQAALLNQSRGLFLPTGALPTLNVRMQNLQAARVRLRESALSSQQWLDVDQQLQAALEQAKQIEAEILLRRQALSRWQRLQKALPVRGRLTQIESEWLTLAEVPALPTDFAEQRLNALHGRRQTAQAIQELELRLQQLNTKIQTVNLPQGLLEQQAAIQSLHTKLGSIRKAAQDRHRLVAELRNLEAEQERMRVDLRDASDREIQAEWTVPARLRQQLLELAAEFQVLTERQHQADSHKARLEKEWQNALAADDPNRPTLEFESLKRDVRHLQGCREADRLAEQAQRTLRFRDDELQAKWQALPLVSGSRETTLALPVPMIETLEEQAAEHARLLQEEQRAKEDCEASRRRLEGLRVEADTLQAAQEVPTEQDLAQIREQRDAAWAELQNVPCPPANPPEDTQVFQAGGSNFRSAAAHFFDLVLAADRIADRLRREADRVAQFAQIQIGLQASHREVTRTEADWQSATERLGDWEQRWRDLWQPLGITPRSPREMMAWLRQFLALREADRECQALRSQCRELASAAQSTRALLEQLLAATAASNLGAQESFSAALQRAEQKLHDWEQSQNAANLRQQRRRQLETEIEEARLRAAETQLDLNNWESGWNAAIQAAGLNPRLSARELTSVLQIHDQWRTAHKEATQLRHRIAGIERDNAQFEAEVLQLRSAAGISADWTAEEAVQKLSGDLTLALQQQTRLEQWQTQLAEAMAQQEQAQREQIAWDDRLQALCQMAGGVTPDELATVEAQANRRRQLANEREELERRLHELAEADEVTAFVEQIDQMTYEDFDWHLQQSQAQLQAAEQTRTEIAERIGRLKRELDGMDGRGEAARWQEEIEQEIAGITNDAQQYIRLRLASGILDRVVDRYRQSNQSTVLQRAANLFAELTQGSFTGLTFESLDNGAFRLLGVRGQNAQTVSPLGMSEGTCDQMYLAIRLALLESYLDHQPPVPLLVDDLFITFDDQRSAAGLQVLARLARRTQIIFFTHHHRLVELAHAHLSSTDFSVQSLRIARQP